MKKIFLCLFVISCASEGNKGKAVGAGSGAALGGLIGAMVSKNKVQGALLGAAIGGGAGLGVGAVIDNKAKKLKEQKLMDMKKTQEGYVGVLSSKILFGTNDSTLLASGQEIIQKIAITLRDCPGCKIIFNGYADKTGNLEKNRALSKARAISVSEVFLFHAPEFAGRVLAQGQGVATDGPTLQDNRRVEMILHQ